MLARCQIVTTPIRTVNSWPNVLPLLRMFCGLVPLFAYRRGIFRSVAELETAIQAYIHASNTDPKPFRWTKSANDILASIPRFCLGLWVQKLRMKRTLESGH
jgi:hypothetical protein